MEIANSLALLVSKKEIANSGLDVMMKLELETWWKKYMKEGYAK